MLIHASNRFLRRHFHSGPKSVIIHSDRRLRIQTDGLHCSLVGKLPKAYKGRLDVTTFQLALKISHPNVFKQTKLMIKMITKLIRVLIRFENKVFFSFLKIMKMEIKFIININ